MGIIGVIRETFPGEHRVALTPEAVGRIRALGLTTIVERNAGAHAWWPDSAYADAGAEIVTSDELLHRADVLLTVNGGREARADWLHEGQILIGLLQPQLHPTLVRLWRSRGVTAISLDLLPRTLSRAQSMDALTSQAAVAGYKAAVLAADTFGGFFPMLTTAAGTVRPARILVLGAGVAGLQAISTARRMGAQVTGYDIRPAAHDDIASLGALFLDLADVDSGAGEGGYARALSGDETTRQQDRLADRIGEFDVVITTAQVPGRKPPVLVTDTAVRRMRPGSVIVDMAASPTGGNVEGSEMDTTTVLGPGVIVVGGGNLPSAIAAAASTAYARNMTALLTHLVRDGQVVIDPTDEIQAAILVTHVGAAVSPAVANLFDAAHV